jgi:hypothetical protein
MNRGIRRVGIAVTLLLLVLVGQLTYLQIVDAKNLDNDPRNLRSTLRDINRARGEIRTSDGEVLARSIPSTDGTDFKYQREYPLGGLTAQIVGYQSFVVGNNGVERTYNDELAGRKLDLKSLGDVLGGKETTGDVRARDARVGAARGRSRARRAEGQRRGASTSPPAGSSRCTPIRPTTRSRWPARHESGVRLLHLAGPRPGQAQSRARVPRDLRAGVDVQGGHERGRLRHGHHHADDRLPRVERTRPPAHEQHAEELRGRHVRW